MKTEPNSSAFADPARALPKNPFDLGTTSPGLTKREYFAAESMKSFAPHVGCSSLEKDMEDCARKAVMYADAVIVELNKPK